MHLTYKNLLKNTIKEKSLTLITNQFDIRFISEVQYQDSCTYYE